MNMDKKEPSFKEDIIGEGRAEAYLDVDRMINEGLSGGSVHMRGETANIEPSIELPKEEPPNTN
jgi:hypothetical protein